MALNTYGKSWHSEQINKYIIEREKYIAYASFLNNVLTAKCEKFAPLAIVQARAKTIPSFAEKAIRKLPQSERLNTFTSVEKWTEHFDPVKQFTDLCGARVITQTQQEVDRVCHFIKKNFEIDWGNSEDKRRAHRPDQFGYLSVHYIVQLKNLEDLMGFSPPPELDGLKAEIQVRTLLQHAWADISHDNLYKHQFEVPDHWQRDMARLAAVLEAADKEFTQFVDNLHTFAGNYRTYMTQEKIDEELSILKELLKYAKKEKDEKQTKILKLRKAKIYEGSAKWEKVEKILEPYTGTNDPVILKTLGNAICRFHRKYYHSKEYQKGKALLDRAVDLDKTDAEAWAICAWAWEPDDISMARECYSKAYSLKPSEPYYLASFLEFEVATRSNFSGKSLMKPALGEAIKTCRSHIEAGIEIPKSLFTVGRLSLLLGESYQSLHSYIEAVNLFLSPKSVVPEESIDGELDFLRRINPAKDSLAEETQEGIEWIRMLLLISKCINSKSKQPIESLPKEDEKDDTKGKDTGPGIEKDDYNGPIVVVAGSCSENEGENLRCYQDIISKALAGYQGEVISGGTSNGISGIVGSLSRLLKKKDRQGFTTIGYLHGFVPEDAYANSGYDLFLRTRGKGFSPLEPLQMWLDLLASGVHPSKVKMLGVGGGKIAAVEYRLAIALGAKVGVIGDSRRAVEEILNDDRWRDHPNLVKLIPDPMTIRALLLSPTSHKLIEEAAMASHNEKVLKKISEIIDPEEKVDPNTILENLPKLNDPAMQLWDNLIEPFKDSCIQQKLYAEAILQYEGYALRKIEDPGKDPIKFSDNECILRMAEMEHGRWNLERIQAGWSWGLEKEVDEKISPSLVPWDELSEEDIKKDVDYVKRWPRDFKKVGLEVYKI